eukprot:TRINITY_DN1781_c0_g2_i1.p1 TRINITY_DN1781_c0_g2~~TRINITY_DN1781_c0_g2_i1.p1  ORF type:complete len:262 (-),score=122.49 TRINITY_DN1781_c0_g2_i1:32-817(-)
MEVAACLKKTKNVPEVVVVTMEEVPFQRVLGNQVGKIFLNWFTENGVQFRLSSGVKEFKGSDAGEVNKVVLSNGEVLEADLVVVGAGVAPRTAFLKPSSPSTAPSVTLKPDGGVVVDSTLKASDGLYAAGDIAYFPWKGKDIRIEHWAVAQQQGKVAAKNMLGKKAVYDEVPFFWSNAFGAGFKYVGYADQFDEVVVDGDEKKRQFLAYYAKDGKVKAVLAMGKNVVPAMELLKEDKLPSVSEIKKGADVEALWKNLQKKL